MDNYTKKNNTTEMDYIIDCLFDFSVMITYHLHDWGTMGNREMFVEEYCNNQKIVDKDCQRTINKYSKYYIKNKLSWFPSRDEVEDWYHIYKKKQQNSL